MSGDRHPANDHEADLAVVQGREQRPEIEFAHPRRAAPEMAVICFERR